MRWSCGFVLFERKTGEEGALVDVIGRVKREMLYAILQRWAEVI